MAHLPVAAIAAWSSRTKKQIAGGPGNLYSLSITIKSAQNQKTLPNRLLTNYKQTNNKILYITGL